MPELYLYVELLVHIKQLTLHASLENPVHEGGQIHISSDKTTITATHNGETVGLYLPTQISGTAEVTFPLEKRTEISTRLTIDDAFETDETLRHSTAIEVPWTANDLGAETAIYCKSCQALVVAPKNISQWKDLPSESWAELMDFWFCHKPHEQGEEHSHVADAKGFGARSTLSVESGVGLLDIASFLLYHDDCTGLETISEQDPLLPALVKCKDCQAPIGAANVSEKSLRIYKSRVSVLSDSNAYTEDYSSSTFACAQMLSLIENSVNRRVVVFSRDGQAEGVGLLCWIFNPDIYYSSSKRDSSAHRAAKILYKDVKDPVKLLDENSTSLEELILPALDFQELVTTLKQSTLYFPTSARTLQEWQVGLLDRYEKVPSAPQVLDHNALNRKAGEMKPIVLPENMVQMDNLPDQTSGLFD